MRKITPFRYRFLSGLSPIVSVSDIFVSNLFNAWTILKISGMNLNYICEYVNVFRLLKLYLCRKHNLTLNDDYDENSTCNIGCNIGCGMHRK